MVNSCETCRFFRVGSRDGGNCHRYPPEQQISFDSEWGHYESAAVFPWTYKTQWCGEYSQSDAAEEQK